MNSGLNQNNAGRVAILLDLAGKLFEQISCMTAVGDKASKEKSRKLQGDWYKMLFLLQDME